MGMLFNKCNEFFELVKKHFGFLEKYGFHISPEHLIASGTLCKVVYLGKNVAIEIYLDIRDQYVGVNVVKVSEGVLKNRFHGGFHSDLGAYLMKRGRFRKAPSQEFESIIEKSLASWANYLQSEGENILADLPSSLPDEK